MSKISPFMIAPPLIFAGFVALVAVGMMRDDPDGLPSTFVGRAAPDIVAEALPGFPTFDASVFADGEVKLVNFWASWCAPCRAEHPNLQELSDFVPIYGVNKQDKPDDATGFLNELGNPFTAITTDAKGRQSIDWGVYGLPETFVLNGEGTVILRFVGPITQRSMASDIWPALEEAGLPPRN